MEVGFLADSPVVRLLLVSERQDVNRIGGRFVAVQSYIAGIAEGNHQFTQLLALSTLSGKTTGCFVNA